MIFTRKCCCRRAETGGYPNRRTVCRPGSSAVPTQVRKWRFHCSYSAEEQECQLFLIRLGDNSSDVPTFTYYSRINIIDRTLGDMSSLHNHSQWTARITSSYPAIGQKLPGTTLGGKRDQWAGNISFELNGSYEDDILPRVPSIMMILRSICSYLGNDGGSAAVRIFIFLPKIKNRNMLNLTHYWLCGGYSHVHRICWISVSVG